MGKGNKNRHEAARLLGENTLGLFIRCLVAFEELELESVSII